MRGELWGQKCEAVSKGKQTPLPPNVSVSCVAGCCISEQNSDDVTVSYLWLWVASFAAPAWIHTVVRRCNFPRHPPPPQVSRRAWCWLWWSSSIQPSHTPGRRHRLISHERITGSTAAPKRFPRRPYLVPGHLRLLVWSQVVFDVRAGDHFAVGYLSLLQVADFAAETFALVALLHRHGHGHFHAVCCVPEQTTNITQEKAHLPKLCHSNSANTQVYWLNLSTGQVSIT